MAGVTLCDVQTLKSRIDAGERLALLDVREPDERAYAAIAPSSNLVDLFIPLGELTARWEDVRDAASGLPVVVYCHHGTRSLMAATWLERQGLGDVANLEGGIDAWSRWVDRGVKRY
jgi:rhodanese-related sulfurtransferase